MSHSTEIFFETLCRFYWSVDGNALLEERKQKANGTIKEKPSESHVDAPAKEALPVEKQEKIKLTKQERKKLKKEERKKEKDAEKAERAERADASKEEVCFRRHWYLLLHTVNAWDWEHFF